MDRLVEIYTEALPVYEQKPRALLEKMLENSNYYFYLLNHKSNNIGLAIVYAPNYSDYLLLEYIAIDSAIRSKGYGGKLMDILTAQFKDKTMVVEIDSPYDGSIDIEIKNKRMEFYKRHGCKVAEGLIYILPLDNANIPEMLILLHSKNYDNFIPKEKLKEWITDVYVKVYGQEVDDKRIDIMFANLPENIRLT